LGGTIESWKPARRSEAGARIAELGSTIFAGSPADFRKLVADQTAKWGKVMLAAHINAK
jgi:hypothetical protein